MHIFKQHLLIICGPAHKNLVLIAYAQRPQINGHANVACRTRGLNVLVIMYVHTLCIRTTSARSLLRSSLFWHLSHMLDDIIWIRICTCTAAYMHVYLVACGGVRASGFKFCLSLRLLHGWVCVFVQACLSCRCWHWFVCFIDWHAFQIISATSCMKMEDFTCADR